MDKKDKECFFIKLLDIFKNIYSSTILFECLKKKQNLTKFLFLNLTLAQLKGERGICILTNFEFNIFSYSLCSLSLAMSY